MDYTTDVFDLFLEDEVESTLLLWQVKVTGFSDNNLDRLFIWGKDKSLINTVFIVTANEVHLLGELLRDFSWLKRAAILSGVRRTQQTVSTSK